MNNPMNFGKGNLAVGLYDVPDAARAMVLYLNLLTSNTVVIGGSMSGKTTFVQGVLARMHEEEPYASREMIYILDFGGNLRKYGELGRVCACFDHSNDENIKRIFRTVEAKFRENSRLLNGENYLTVLQRDPEHCPPHITLIIENANLFFAEERYGIYHDLLLTLARDGLSKGVSILMTASDPGGGMGRVMSYFNAKFALDMPQEKYFDLFFEKADAPMKGPGRGLTTVPGKLYEFQVFLPFRENEENEKLDVLCRKSPVSPDEKIRSFPAVLTADGCRNFNPDVKLSREEIPVGLDYYEYTPVCWNTEEVHCAAIYGKKQFGKTNLLRILLDGVCERYPDALFVFLDDGREQMKEFRDRYDRNGAHRAYFTKVLAEFVELHKQLFSVPKKDDAKPEKLPEVIVEFVKLYRQRSADSRVPIFFVIQNRQIFLQKPQSRSTGAMLDTFGLASQMSEAETQNCWYLFTDVPKIPDIGVYGSFNAQIRAAFLLDNIAEFLVSKGHSSVFGAMDAVELKYEYARCEIGDGYFYDIDREDLRKVKFIKNARTE